jgi:hypothetical protein
MKNIGTLVTAAIRPNDSNDKIASAYAVEVKGGLHSYATLLERNNIISERREWGMIVNVYNDTTPANNTTWILKYNKVNTTITDNLNWEKYLGSSGSVGGSAYWIDPVISILSNQPSGPANGDRYILGPLPVGVSWGAKFENDVVQYDLDTLSWITTTPLDNMSVRVEGDDNSLYKYDGTSWVREGLNQVLNISATSSNAINYNSTDLRISSYQVDTLYMVQFATANSGTVVTLDVNGIGAMPVVQQTNYGTASFTGKDISTKVIYNLQYDGSNFRLTKPNSDPVLIKYSIRPTETIIVPAYQEYLVYGDLEVCGLLNIDPLGKVVIINGALNINGGSIINSYNVQLVTLSQTVSNIAVRKSIFTMPLNAGVPEQIVHNLDSMDIVVSVYDSFSLVTSGISVSIGSNNDIDITSTNTIASARIIVMG